MKTVFISSPYSLDPEKYVQLQIDISDFLINLGFNPLPLVVYCHQIHLQHPKEYKFWVDLTLEWVSKCDYLLRLPGESHGADGEVEEAKRLGIPVFYSVDELIKYCNENE